MSLVSIAELCYDQTSFVIWLITTSHADRYQLSITDAVQVWTSTVNLKEAPREYPDAAAYRELVLRCLRRQDTGSFHYELNKSKDAIQLSFSRLISTTAGSIRQGLLSIKLKSESDSQTDVMLLLQQCISKIDTFRTERRKLHMTNERLVNENAQLQEYHDKACEAKLLSEEDIISHISDLQAEIERNLLQHRDAILSRLEQQVEREQSPSRESESPVKESVAENISGIKTALDQATKTELISNIHRGRKRRAGKAGNSTALTKPSLPEEETEKNNKRVKMGKADDLISQLE